MDGRRIGIEVLSGFGQQARYSEPFRAPIVVRVLDGDGKPVANTRVTFRSNEAGEISFGAQQVRGYITRTGPDGVATSGTVFAGNLASYGMVSVFCEFNEDYRDTWAYVGLAITGLRREAPAVRKSYRV